MATATPKICMRDATVEDISAVHSFLMPFMKTEQILPRTPEQLAALLPCSQVALEGEKVVGFVALEIYSHKLAEIQCLCVDPSMQGKGIGRQLVDFCVQVAKKNSVLELMAISASDHFLKNCGFDYSLPGQKKALFIQPSADQNSNARLEEGE